MTRVLVAGATGRLGKPVALYLRAAGHEIRAITRRPEICGDLVSRGIEIVAADVSVVDGLVAACIGCDAIYISLRGTNDVASYEQSEIAGVRNLVRAGHEARVNRIVYLSGAGRTVGNERHFPVRVKQACEAALQGSGIPYTIFRATHFMESLPWFVRGSAAEVLGRQPHSYHYVAVDDYAEMVGAALGTPAAANRIFTVFGPEAFTMREALGIYLSYVRPGLPIRTAPLPVLRLVAALKRDQNLRFATDLFAAFAALGEEGDPMPANQLLGAPRTTLAEWSMRQRG